MGKESKCVVAFSAGELTDKIEAEINEWQAQKKVERLWKSDPTLWTGTDENKWMGWLNITDDKKDIPEIESLCYELNRLAITDIVLMGMGGSSLFPDLMANTFGKIKGYPQLHILDSTDPSQIRHLEQRINLAKTFFIVSSKSGNTLEPTIFKNYFFGKLSQVLKSNEVPKRFLAITDPGTPLEIQAKTEQFKQIFYGLPSIGGRYSALSNFGLVPSGLMGIDLNEFLSPVNGMRKACSPATPIFQNPGVILGIILGVCGNEQKNKITLIVSPEIKSLGAWLEQLLAESTGKQGKGLIPVDEEPLGDVSVYSNDRVFVYIRLESAPDINQDAAINRLEKSGFVVIRLNVVNKMHLAAELFRWEIATAVAGSVLGINPFNQPDVEESKILTLKFTKDYEIRGTLPKTTAFFSANDISLFTDDTHLKTLNQQLEGEPSLVNYLKTHFDCIKQNDYFNISAFIEMSTSHLDLLQNSRTLIRDYKKVATCLGFGPRFLHSTGQVYKGGANTGVFLQITSDHKKDIAVPGYHFTFGVVINAQAQADFEVLAKRDRRILRIHLENCTRGLQELFYLIQQALKAE